MRSDSKLRQQLAILLISILVTGCQAVQKLGLTPSDSTATPTPHLVLTPTPALPAPPLDIDDGQPFPLSAPGPYQVATRSGISIWDASRNGREVVLTLWYPAQSSGDSDSSSGEAFTPADSRGAPFPLILCSAKTGHLFAKILASYGFVVAGVNGIDYYYPWDQNLVDQPLDLLFALDHLSLNPPEGLENLIDYDRSGALGYSFDGYNSLALSGARVDPEHYLAACNTFPLPAYWIEGGYCFPKKYWENFETHAGASLTTSTDGLWQPMTDERVKAVMPMAPEGRALFGDRGLAAADRAMLIIGAETDEICDYREEAVYIYDHVSSSDKSLITFILKGHLMIYEGDVVTRLSHFAVAFFGHQLLGRSDLAYYYSPEYVNQQPGLTWGAYQE